MSCIVFFFAAFKGNVLISHTSVLWLLDVGLWWWWWWWWRLLHAVPWDVKRLLVYRSFLKLKCVCIDPLNFYLNQTVLTTPFHIVLHAVLLVSWIEPACICRSEKFFQQTLYRRMKQMLCSVPRKSCRYQGNSKWRCVEYSFRHAEKQKNAPELSSPCVCVRARDCVCVCVFVFIRFLLVYFWTGGLSLFYIDYSDSFAVVIMR